MSDDQRDKRRQIVEGNYTRGCDPEQYRTRCTGNEADETNPCSGKGVGAQEDGAHPVPSDQKACSWIAKQVMTKKELDDACRVDSVDADDADYYMTDQRESTNHCIYRIDETTWKQVAKNEANACDEHIQTLHLWQPELVRRVWEPVHPHHVRVPPRQVQPGQHGKVLLRGWDIQQGGFRPMGASCSPGKGDCLGSTWDGQTCTPSAGRPLGTRPVWHLPPEPGLPRGRAARQPPVRLEGIGRLEAKPEQSVDRQSKQPSPCLRHGVDARRTPKEKADPRSESADALWSKSCGTVFVTGAKPFCTARFEWDNSHLTKDGLEEVGRIRWDVWEDAARVPFPSAYTKGLVRKPEKTCNSTDLKQPGCPCDQSPNSKSKCKVDFGFQYCKRPTYQEDIQWCAENCDAFKHVLTCGPFPRPGCDQPKSKDNPNGYPVSKDDVAKFIAENQTMCQTMRGSSTLLASPAVPSNDYDKEVASRLNDAVYCRAWMLGNYAKGKDNAPFRASICNSTILTNGAGTGIVDLCNVRQATACKKGQDGTTPMAHCPGWKQNNAFGDFCRKVALAYPVQADAAKIAYCEREPVGRGVRLPEGRGHRLQAERLRRLRTESQERGRSDRILRPDHWFQQRHQPTPCQEPGRVVQLLPGRRRQRGLHLEAGLCVVGRPDQVHEGRERGPSRGVQVPEHVPEDGAAGPHLRQHHFRRGAVVRGDGGRDLQRVQEHPHVEPVRGPVQRPKGVPERQREQVGSAAADRLRRRHPQARSMFGRQGLRSRTRPTAKPRGATSPSPSARSSTSCA